MKLGRLCVTIAEVMNLLSQIPQGGVGLSGASLEEIERAEQEGRCVENDAVYHVVQKAWLLLYSMRKEDHGTKAS